MQAPYSLLLALLASLSLSACQLDAATLGKLLPSAHATANAAGNSSSDIADLCNRNLNNSLAYIPWQWFTKTQDEQGRSHNPCFACHIGSSEPNFIDDGDVQLA